MVMLDMAKKLLAERNDELIVAHFDHGIRENSAKDAEFVRQKAAEYGLECRVGEGWLGADTSEAVARAARYDFLETVAEKFGKAGEKVEIWTAHHLDDLVETVTINLVRGTGWRGLAALDNTKMRRPLLDAEIIYEPMDKAAIIEYAAKRGLCWREDESNSWDEYLRNRIRHEMNNVNLSFEQKLQIYELWRQQRKLKAEIDRMVAQLLPELNTDGTSKWQRRWFRRLAENTTDVLIAQELLRAGLLRQGIKATRPQIEDFRQAIMRYESGKKFNLPEDRLVKIGKEEFEL